MPFGVSNPSLVSFFFIILHVHVEPNACCIFGSYACWTVHSVPIHLNSFPVCFELNACYAFGSCQCCCTLVPVSRSYYYAGHYHDHIQLWSLCGIFRPPPPLTRTKYEISPLFPPFKVGLRVVWNSRFLVTTIEPFWGWAFFLSFLLPNCWTVGTISVPRI